MAASKEFVLVILLLAYNCYPACATASTESEGVRPLVSCFTDIAIWYYSNTCSTSDVVNLFQKCSESLDHVSCSEHSCGVNAWFDAFKEELKTRTQEHRIKTVKEFVAETGVRMLFNLLSEDTKHKVIEDINPMAKEFLRLYSGYGGESRTFEHVVYLVKVIVSTSAGKETTKAAGALAKIRQYSPLFWIGTELTEYGLTKMGYERAGHIVGTIGTTVSMGMTGFTLLGPVGAVIGAGTGLYSKLSENNAANSPLEAK